MLSDLKVKTRFAILIGIIIITRIVVGFVETNSFNIIKDDIDSVYFGSIDDIKLIDEIRNEYAVSLLDIIYQSQNGKISATQAHDSIKEMKTRISDYWAQYIKDAKIHSHVLDNSSLSDRIESQMKEVSVALDKFLTTMKENNKEALTKLNMQEVQSLVFPLLKDLYQLIDLHIEETHTDYQDALTSIQSIKLYSLFTFLISTAVVVLIAIWIFVDLAKSLNKANEVIHKLTIGDLNFHIENCSKSELGQMLESMNTLAAAKRKITDALTEMSQGNLDISITPRSDKDSLGFALVNLIKNLRNIIGEIQLEVADMTTSSQEVVSSVSQIATTSAETAAAVSETTTSIEELKQTAQMSEEKAKDVLANSEETLQIVNTSEKLLQTTIDDMKQISDRMRTISEGIVKLSEHSQTIGDIIDTVNDLAEQSNLLAVNAAIEAAKAGEHGKGFVVVAQEIRTLAEQSKSATIQVRSILNEIQNSTTAAVLATEQGAKAVEKGVKQSAQTNESMQMLAVNVSHATQAANQIVISNQQQFVGIDQVTVAMNNISEASIQLVDNMKQMESAVTSFNEIGENLKGLTDQYIMSTGDEGDVRPSMSRKKMDKNK